MGTRNLTIVRLDGKVRVKKYCQWDGYPKGQGKHAKHFITKQMNLELFKEQVRKLRFATKKEVSDAWKSVGASDYGATMEQSDLMKKKFPYLQRDMGTKILMAIQKGKVPYTEKDDGRDWAWAWELNLDKEVLKVFYGYCGKSVMTIPFSEVGSRWKEVLALDKTEE